MRIAIIAASFAAFVVAAPAHADETTLTVNNALALKAALAEMSAGAPTVIKDGERQSVAMQPFTLTPAVRAALAKDTLRLDAALETSMKELRALGQKLCPNDKCDDESRAERDRQSQAIGDRKLALDLIPFTESELNMEKNAGLTPRLLGMLSPLLPFLKEKN